MFIVTSALRAWLGFMRLIMGLAATGTLIDLTWSSMNAAAAAHEVGFMSMVQFNRLLQTGGSGPTERRLGQAPSKRKAPALTK